jgi:photosystem II stability/assembly factor-like uncharacterized protein
MKKIISLISFALIAIHLSAQQPVYKAMMNDSKFNFYQVCDSAEAYFKTIEKDKKGSGYKPFLRWKYDNESKYFPSGDRIVDEYLPYKEYERIKQEQSANTNNQRLFMTGGWQSLGPDSIGVITGHYAAGLGRVEYAEVNKTNTQRIYIGSRSGGLWSTTNGGATWAHNTDFLPASGVNAISASPTNFDSLLINVQNAGNGTSFGIYRSINGGATFVQTLFNPSNPSLGFGGLGSNFKINVIKYHPTIPNLIFVGTDRGIYRSTDNLQTWVRLNNTWDVKDIEFHPTNTAIIYVYENYYWGTNKNKIYKSTNQGVSYLPLLDLLGNNDAQIQISVSPTCPTCVFATSNNGIWKSFNEGNTFNTIVNPAPVGVSLWSAIPNDLDTSKFISGGIDVFRSTNGGLNFNQCTWWSLGSTQHGGTNNQTAYNASSVYVHADLSYATSINGVFYICTDGFLCKSVNNGLTWQKLSLSTGIRENYNLGLSQSNHYRSITGSQDNGTSIKTQNGWVEFYGADGMEGIIHPLNDDWMIGSFQYGGRRRTLDGGLTSTGASQPQSGSGNGAWIAPMVYDPNDQMVVYSFAKNVFKSTDFGATWAMLGSASTFTTPITFASIAENNSNIMAITNQDKIELSTNGGVSFISIKNNLPTNSITDVVFDPKRDSTIIVTYDTYQNNGQKIYITKNLGATWQNITYNLGNMPIYSAIIDHTDSSTIYVGAAIGIYKKSMNANTWTLYNTSLPNVCVKELEINYGSNTIKAATWGRGLWEYALANRKLYPAIVTTSITSPVTFNTPKTTIAQYVTSTINYTGGTLTSVFVRWAINTPSFTVGNSIPMSLASGTTWVSNTPLPNFPAGTKVFFKVFAIGGNADTTETYKFMYELRPFQYCAAAGENTNGALWINTFTCANVTNSNTGFTTNTYYSNLPIIVYKDSTYTATGNFNQSWGNNDFITWIDYNEDATFAPSEKVVFDPNTGILGTGTFTIPNTAVEDTVRMRVRLGYWGANNSDDPCGTTLGEIEDYPVIIRKAPNISINGSTSFCSGSNLNLNYTGSVADSVKWILTNGLNTYSITGNAVNTSILTLGTYSVSLKAYKYGVAFTKNYANYFVINPSPNITIASTSSLICVGQTVSLTVSGANTYTWNTNSNASVIAVSPTITTVYTVNGMGLNSCSTNSSITQNVSLCAALENRFIQNNFSSTIFPNPTDGVFYVELNGQYTNAKIEMINVLGEHVFSEKIINTTNSYNISHLATGVYFITIIHDTKKDIFKVIKN